jgi:hypothetical protein
MIGVIFRTGSVANRQKKCYLKISKVGSWIAKMLIKIVHSRNVAFPMFLQPF